MSGKKHKKPKLSPPLAYDYLIVNLAARTVTYHGLTIVCSLGSATFAMPVLEAYRG